MTEIPAWKGFWAAPEVCFVELDLRNDNWKAEIANVPESVARVVLSVRGEKLMWMPAAVSHASEALLQGIELLQARGKRVAILPRADGFPSDIPSTLSFLRAHESAKIELFVEPAMLFTVEMAATAADHIARIRDALLSHPCLTGVIISNIGEGSERTSCDGGILKPELLCGLENGLPPHVATYRVNKV